MWYFFQQYHRPSGGSGQGHHRGDPHGAPPPYPGRGGSSNAAHPPGAPGRGYGEGRGHYNRSRDHYVGDGQPVAGSSHTGHHGGGSARGSSGGQRQDRGGDRRSGHRSSRIEMQPMRQNVKYYCQIFKMKLPDLPIHAVLEKPTKSLFIQRLTLLCM